MSTADDSSHGTTLLGLGSYRWGPFQLLNFSVVLRWKSHRAIKTWQARARSAIIETFLIKRGSLAV